MKTLVKICGITSLADAKGAVAAGADALGFNFYEKSPRCIPLTEAKKISILLKAEILRVGVFVNATKEEVTQAIQACGLSLLQFHGEETPEYCAQFNLKSMKAFRIRDAESLKGLARYPTDAWLLDAYSPGARGGTGATFNWALAKEAQKLGKPIFLAGGLTPENVAEAVRQVRPYGVDVAGGVESSPGKKDPAKVEAFIKAVRAVE
jgi:phosphoribosylanthranilate isomerase